MKFSKLNGGENPFILASALTIHLKKFAEKNNMTIKFCMSSCAALRLFRRRPLVALLYEARVQLHLFDSCHFFTQTRSQEKSPPDNSSLNSCTSSSTYTRLPRFLLRLVPNPALSSSIIPARLRLGRARLLLSLPTSSPFPHHIRHFFPLSALC